MIPKISDPLAKSIRTGEGILVYALNIFFIVVGALPHGLSWTHTAIFMSIVTGAHVIARTLLKVSALLAPAGIPAVDPQSLVSDAVEFASPVPASEEEAKAADAAEVSARSGAPAKAKGRRIA